MYKETQIVSCGCEKFYDVVADVASYPQYLPGWDNVQVSEQSDGTLRVSQHIRFGPINEQMVSVARFNRPKRIIVEPVANHTTAGIALQWHFSSTEDGCCEVALQVEGRARNPIVRGMLNTLVHQTTRNMIQRFTQRVQAIYDEPCKILK